MLDQANAALLIVDVQEAFRSPISDLGLIASRIAVAARGMSALGVPVLVTEQYPKGLGHTVEEIKAGLPDDARVFEKTAFSAADSPEVLECLSALGTRTVLICGIETHICVNQTSRGLLAAGFDVHVLTDCVASRFDHDRTAGLARMAAAGAVTSSVEMALFELMRGSSHDKFKEIQAMIK
jgi:nicotinamidase-related amidase